MKNWNIWFIWVNHFAQVVCVNIIWVSASLNHIIDFKSKDIVNAVMMYDVNYFVTHFFFRIMKLYLYYVMLYYIK